MIKVKNQQYKYILIGFLVLVGLILKDQDETKLMEFLSELTFLAETPYALSAIKKSSQYLPSIHNK